MSIPEVFRTPWFFRPAQALTRARARVVPLRWRRWHFVAVIVGRESGAEYRLDFCQFPTAPEAQEFCDVMNATVLVHGLTRFEVRPR